MFGFLKGKQKGKGNSSQEANGKQLPKEKYRRQKIDKKERQKLKLDENQESRQASNSLSKKIRFSRRNNSLQELYNSGEIPSEQSRTPTNQSTVSLDQSIITEANGISENSDVNSKSSSYCNIHGASNSSSEASIPSIITEFVDDSSSPVQNYPCLVLNKSSNAASTSSVGSNYALPLSLCDTKPGFLKSRGTPFYVNTNSIPITRPVGNSQSFSGKDVPSQVPKYSFNDDEDTSVSSSVYSSPPSPGPYSNNNSMADHSSRPTSPDEDRSSILSTPADSTTSLSSISLHPNSPSGRRTPPGPKMGTIAKLGSSPTPTRKISKTNIKTNPNLGLKVLHPVPYHNSEKERTYNNWNMDNKIIEFHNTTEKSNLSEFQSPSANNICNEGMYKEELLNNLITNNSITETVISQGSAMPLSIATQKIRHSITSMHSLESIPENDLNNEESGNEELNINNKHDEVSIPNGETNARRRQMSSSSMPQLAEETAYDEIEDKIDEIVSKSPDCFAVTDEIIDSNLVCNSENSKMISDENIFSVGETTNSIVKYYDENRIDEELSDSLREPEIKEHKLELIPDSPGMKNNITFTTVTNPFKVSQSQNSSIVNNENLALVNKNSNLTAESDPDSSCSLSPSTIEPTHVVFQIPLRSKSNSRDRTVSPHRPNLENEFVQSDNPNNSNANCPAVLGNRDIVHNKVEESAVHCIEGHVELNFDRGRSEQRSSKVVSRNRSRSSARRQKLFEDIKKFTAQTKEMQLVSNPKRNIDNTLSSNESLNTSAVQMNSFADQTVANEMNEHLIEDKRLRSSSSDMRPIRPRSVSSHRKGCNTLPRAGSRKLEPRKLERSVTVAEISINVEKNTVQTIELANQQIINEQCEFNDVDNRNKLLKMKSNEKNHLPTMSENTLINHDVHRPIVDGSFIQSVTPLNMGIQKIMNSKEESSFSRKTHAIIKCKETQRCKSSSENSSNIVTESNDADGPYLPVNFGTETNKHKTSNKDQVVTSNNSIIQINGDLEIKQNDYSKDSEEVSSQLFSNNQANLNIACEIEEDADSVCSIKYKSCSTIPVEVHK